MGDYSCACSVYSVASILVYFKHEQNMPTLRCLIHTLNSGSEDILLIPPFNIPREVISYLLIKGVTAGSKTVSPESMQCYIFKLWQDKYWKWGLLSGQNPGQFKHYVKHILFITTCIIWLMCLRDIQTYSCRHCQFWQI